MPGPSSVTVSTSRGAAGSVAVLYRVRRRGAPGLAGRQRVADRDGDRGALRGVPSGVADAGWRAPGAAGARRRGPAPGRRAARAPSGGRAGRPGRRSSPRSPAASCPQARVFSGRPASSLASSSRSSTSTLILVDSDSTRPSAWVTVSGESPGCSRRQLGVAADGGERGAQLVAGVGGEPAQPRLAGRAPPQRGLDVPEHAVERQPELAGLGARVGVRHARWAARPRRTRAAARPPGTRWRRPGAAGAATAGPTRCRARRRAAARAPKTPTSASATSLSRSCTPLSGQAGDVGRPVRDR